MGPDGSEAGSYVWLIDRVYHSTLGLRVIKKKISGFVILVSDFGQTGFGISVSRFWFRVSGVQGRGEGQ